MVVVNIPYPSPQPIRFPQACACCLAATPDHHAIRVELGQEHTKDKWHEDYKSYKQILDLKVPYCKGCTAHAEAHGSSALLMIASVLHIFTLSLFYWLVTKPLLEPFVERSIRAKLGQSSCGGMQAPEVVRIGDNLCFKFGHAYAQHFLAANQPGAVIEAKSQPAT
jgi:hypothetical protein